MRDLVEGGKSVAAGDEALAVDEDGTADPSALKHGLYQLGNLVRADRVDRAIAADVVVSHLTDPLSLIQGYHVGCGMSSNNLKKFFSMV